MYSCMGHSKTSVAMMIFQHTCTYTHKMHFTHPVEMSLQPQQGGKESLDAFVEGVKALCGWHVHFQSAPKCSLGSQGLQR